MSDLKNLETVTSKVGTGGNKQILAVHNNRIVEQGFIEFLGSGYNIELL